MTICNFSSDQSGWIASCFAVNMALRIGGKKK